MMQMIPLRADPTRRLLRLLVQGAGPDAWIAEARATPWASGLFDGIRHDILLDIEGDDAARRARDLAAALPEMEFAIRGYIVADCAVDAVTARDDGGQRLHLSVLTLRED